MRLGAFPARCPRYATLGAKLPVTFDSPLRAATNWAQLRQDRRP